MIYCLNVFTDHHEEGVRMIVRGREREEMIGRGMTTEIKEMSDATIDVMKDATTDVTINATTGAMTGVTTGEMREETDIQMTGKR